MATLLLAPPTTHAGPPQEPGPATATLVLVRSPIPGADHHLRVVRSPLEAGRTVAASLPTEHAWAKVVWNGGVLSEAEQAEVLLQPGDELWLWPQWGLVGGTLGALLIGAAVSIAIGFATQYLTYLLFPPAKPHINAPEDHSFSFEGIRTAVGPGSIVPIVYGRHRVGGQLISAAVDQALTVIEDGGPMHRIDLSAAPPTLSMLLAMGEGPIASIDTTTMQINGQPIQNYLGAGPQLSARLGTPDQAPLPEFAEQRNTFADGQEIPWAPSLDTEIRHTTTQPVDAFILNIVFNRGLFNINKKGEKEVNTVTIYYRFAVVTGTSIGNFEPWTAYEVSADRTAPVRFAIRRENLVHETYAVALCFANPRHYGDTNAQYQPTLESVSEVQRNTLAYPNTALLGIRTFPSDGLQGSLPNMTVDVIGRTVRVGVFTPTETWSDNPAWCVMDFLTSPRYGLGIPDADIDLQTFAVWAAYCDEVIDGEPRHRFNYVVAQDGRAQQILMDMMAGSRALLIKSGGLWTPRVTRDEPPVQLLSWANCRNVRLTYTRDADRVNVMEARFANEEHAFEQDVLTWPPVEQWPAEVHKQSLEIRGVTKPSRIMRALQFELNRRRFETVLLEMDASLEAVALQVHDVFRFAHPLPGWGVSGRIADGSTASVLHLDEDVTMQPGITYHLYLRFPDDGTDARVVSNPGTGLPTRTVTIAGEPFQQHPYARTTLWAFGATTPESAVKLFRVTKLQRKNDTTVHLQAVAHNASIYDEPTGTPLLPMTGLPNPLGLPPPLTFLVLTEVTRVQPSGASLRVVNLSWDVAPLSAGFAPYGGAQILRRTVLSSGQAGTAQAGAVDLGAIHDANDANVDFVPLVQVRGHVLDFDDFTVLTGITYIYRVIPVSQRGVPNQGGALTEIIHVAGPTTPDFFPGTVRNLRLQGQAVGVLTFEGRDIHFAWDPVADSPLFSETFFVQDYIVEIWAPGQEYLMRRTVVQTTARGTEVSWTYSYEQNSEDQIRNGMAGPRRDVAIYVYARTNTGRISLDPASIVVANPPPDMSTMAPSAKGLFQAALIEWTQYVEPRDFAFYTIYLDTVNPPRTVYQDAGIAFKKIFPGDLLANVAYYVFILPSDSFGPGLASQVSTFTPVSLDADVLDTVPPVMPTGLALSTGTTVSADGTIVPWVQADWTANTEADLAAYDVRFRLGTTAVPTAMTISAPEHALRLDALPGNLTVFVKLAAYDQFYNLSPFTPEQSITTARDTVPPGPPTTLVAHGSFKAIALLWSPPADRDYAVTEVWASQTNNLPTALKVGEDVFEMVHAGLLSNATWYYWLRARDTSGNLSAFVPGATAGLTATTVQTSTADIGNLSIDVTKITDNSISTPKLQANSVDANKVTTGELITLGAQIRNAIIGDAHISTLSVGKLTTGTLQVLVSVSVDNTTFIDGNYGRIFGYDRQAVPALRYVLGRLSDTDPTLYGLNIWNGVGQLMWHFSAGASTLGIQDNAINAAKIQAATIVATHLRTDTAVITTAAQIANALIGFAHIQNLAVGTTHLQAESVTAAKIGLNQILTGHVADAQISSAKIGAAQILAAHIADAQITTAKIGLAQIMEGHIVDGQITTAKIQDAHITAAKIANANILTAHIGDLQVDTLKIANLAVLTGKIAANAVTVALQVTSGLACSLTFNGLQPGDQVWLMGTGTAAVALAPGLGSANMALYLDSNTGALVDSSFVQQETPFYTVMAVQAVYTAPSAENRTFVLEMGATSGTTRFVGMWRKK